MVKTRILIISDTHCARLTEQGHPKVTAPPFRLPLPKADVLIHCGDLTMTGEMDEYHTTLDMLKQIDAPVKLVIAGNHDLSLDRDFVFSHQSTDVYSRQPRMTAEQAEQRHKAARDLWTADNGRAKQEGITFLDEGTYAIPVTNGAMLRVYASPYTPEFYDWGFPYERNEDRFNKQDLSFSDAKNIATNIIPPRSEEPVDIVITHGPAWLRLDPTMRGDPAGCPHLLRALMQTRPLIHCFGHIHEGWGGERVQWPEEISSAVTKRSTMLGFKEKEWQAGIQHVSPIDVNEKDMSEHHAAYVDVSTGSAKPLQPGKETLFINAAIMDVLYKPANAPWLIDVDLPASEVKGAL